MSLGNCTGPFAVANAERILEEFLMSEREQLFILTGDSGIGKKTTVRNKMQLINKEVRFHRYTVIEDKDIFRKSLEAHPSDIHVW